MGITIIKKGKAIQVVIECPMCGAILETTQTNDIEIKAAQCKICGRIIK